MNKDAGKVVDVDKEGEIEEAIINFCNAKNRVEEVAKNGSLTWITDSLRRLSP